VWFETLLISVYVTWVCVPQFPHLLLRPEVCLQWSQRAVTVSWTEAAWDLWLPYVCSAFPRNPCSETLVQAGTLGS
jgi:hypothetical protein